MLVDIKLDSDQIPRREATQSDFLLSAEVVRLMELLDKVPSDRQVGNSRGHPSKNCLGEASVGGTWDMIFACREAGRI